MMSPIQKNKSIIVSNDDNLQNVNCKPSNVYHKNIHPNSGVTTRKKQPCIQDCIKLIHVDDEYSGLTQGICGTISGIYAANEICKSVNRPESIIWVKWDNGVELGLIEGIDKYEIVSSVTTNSSQAAQQTVSSH
jgi:hypothetical protein